MENTINNLYEIIDRSERATVRIAYRLRNLQEKFARYRNHLTFMMRCRDLDVVPKGLRMISTIKSARVYRIIDRTHKAIIRERIGHIRRKKIWLREQLQITRYELSKNAILDVERKSISGQRLTRKRRTSYAKNARRTSLMFC